MSVNSRADHGARGRGRPRLTFWCECGPAELAALAADGEVVEALAGLGAGVSLAVTDLSDERAGAVRRLTDAGVPVTAWLLLAEADGYFLTLDNAPRMAARYDAWAAWSDAQALRWAGVGLDVEPDLRLVRRLLGPDRWRALADLPRRVLDAVPLRRAREALLPLLARMRADGYPVETYQFPFIVDDRESGSTLLQRAFGVLDLPADREVLMCYTSLAVLYGLPAGGLLWSYAPGARAIGIGSTGGGIALPTLDWNTFARDLRLGARCVDEIFVFSLEGCARGHARPAAHVRLAGAGAVAPRRGAAGRPVAARAAGGAVGRSPSGGGGGGVRIRRGRRVDAGPGAPAATEGLPRGRPSFTRCRRAGLADAVNRLRPG